MLRFLPPGLRGSLALVVFVLNTLFWCSILYLVTALRLLVPVPAFVRLCRRLSMTIATAWIGGNVLGLKALTRIEWDVTGMEGLERKAWYVVTPNHVSWVDIVIVQWLFNRKIPMLKFFLKEELKKVPVLGLAWWCLEFPFMKRIPRAVLEKRPELKGKDLETTKEACERFADLPVSVLNFLEGTRFSERKRVDRGSPYRHLLSPKAGGLAQVVSTLGPRIRSLLDVTVFYPGGAPTFWGLLSGRLEKVVVRVEAVPLDPAWFGADYEADAAFREGFQAFVGDLWKRKDDRIDALLASARPGLPAVPAGRIL